MEAPKSRLLVISNRLPVTVRAHGNGKYDFQMSSGGLVSGLSGLLKKTKFQWFGWPGLEVPDGDIAHLEERLAEEHNAVPIFLDDDLAERHYNGFSNSILWPLLHYSPEKMSFDEASSAAYRKVNQLFAEAVAPHVRDHDLIWVHDYHLMLLPAMLRQELANTKQNVKIGFFLHTPFPSSDFFTILPGRDEILKGLLSCNLIGFHTDEYAQHFLHSCSTVLGLDTSEKGVHFEGRHITTGAFPIGIDPSEFHNGLNTAEVKDNISALSQQFKDVRVMVGVDRMDYIKGVPQKLHAFDAFLTKYPEWVGKVVLIQVAVPTRPDVEEYQRLRTEVNGLIGSITGKYGSITYTPIHFMHKSISKEELISLYAISDACLVSSTRDGMNLVSYEYVACQHERRGVLVLSEYAGAAKMLPGYLIVNPWDVDDFVRAIHDALTMDEGERRRRHEEAERFVNEHTSFYWGKTYLQQLEEAE